MRLFTLSIVPLVVAGTLHAQDLVGGVPYERLDTRMRTEQAMMQKLLGVPALDWSGWSLLSPFPGREQGTLKAPLPPEDELRAMRVDGPGPDLGKTYSGKNGMKIGWKPTGTGNDTVVNLQTNEDSANNVLATCYLYQRVGSANDAKLPVTMGSDDGLRFWLNGELLVDADVPRGLDPEAHRLDLPLKKGVNHILAKVTQGQGGWGYQLNTSVPLDPVHDAQLQYLLNRDFPTAERGFYPDTTIPVPDGIVLEVGGLDVLSDGRPVACTRRGDVYIIDRPGEGLDLDVGYTLFATGLHEPLGVEIRREDGHDAVYCVQRGELTRLVDLDGDDRADLYETVCDEWGVSGGYHEFSFGPKFDGAGNAWVTLNVDFCGGLGKSTVPYRGWALKVTPDGEMIPVCGGLRSPNGIGLLPNGDAFYVDNQGDYVGTNKLSHLKPGSWHGHPSGLRWIDGWKEGDPEPERQRPAVWLPYTRMGQSTADIAIDDTGGLFGPFSGQMFVGDQFSAFVLRVFLEEVDGVYQGACFPFRKDLDCGVNRIAFDTDGNMYIGQTDRGWASQGRRRYGIQRITWSGDTPFEALTMRAAPDGFVLTFTEDVNAKTLADVGSYRMTSHTYNYHSNYGSPETEKKTLKVVSASPIGKRAVHLRVDGVRSGGEGYVHELTMTGLRNANGEPLLHDKAYYTVQVIPDSMPVIDATGTSMR